MIMLKQFGISCTLTSKKALNSSGKIVAEDRILEEMVQHEKLKDMFEKISCKEKGSNLETILSSALESDLWRL